MVDKSGCLICLDNPGIEHWEECKICRGFWNTKYFEFCPECGKENRNG